MKKPVLNVDFSAKIPLNNVILKINGKNGNLSELSVQPVRVKVKQKIKERIKIIFFITENPPIK